MKKILIILIISFLFLPQAFAEQWKWNPFTNKLDKVNDKASELKVTDSDGNFGSTGSPPTVESALKELSEGTTLTKTYVPFINATKNVDLGTQTLTASDVTVGGGRIILGGDANDTGITFGNLGTATAGLDLSSSGLSGTDQIINFDANNRLRADGIITWGRAAQNINFTVESGGVNIIPDGTDSNINVDIEPKGTGNVNLRGDVFTDNDTSAVFGHTTQLAGPSTSEFQVLGTAAADSSILLSRSIANANSPHLYFIKSRGTAIGDVDAVVDDDNLGQIYWVPADGSALTTQAAIFAVEVDDATPAAGDVGVAYVWMQMGGGGVANRETMRLNAAGNLILFGTASADVVDTQFLEYSSGGALTIRDNLTVNGSISSTNFPSSSTNNAIVRFDGTGGNTFQDSGVTIDDNDNISVPGDISIGANALKTTNLLFKETDSDTFIIRDAADTDDKSLDVRELFANTRVQIGSNGVFGTKSSNNSVIRIQARVTDTADLNVARIVSAPDPWFEFGSSGDFKFTRSNTFELPGSGIIDSSGNLGLGTTNPAYKLDVRGDADIEGLTLTVNHSAIDYTATASDDMVVATGAITITLPTAVGIDGKIYHVKNTVIGTVTIDPSGSETIDEDTTVELTTKNQSLSFFADGGNWLIF